jgi:hypothetical protein
MPALLEVAAELAVLNVAVMVMLVCAVGQYAHHTSVVPVRLPAENLLSREPV